MYNIIIKDIDENHSDIKKIYNDSEQKTKDNETIIIENKTEKIIFDSKIKKIICEKIIISI